MVPSSSQLAQSLIASAQADPQLFDKKVSKLVDFLKEFHLVNLLPEIRRHIAHHLQQYRQSQGCHITTALPLNEEARTTLLKALGIDSSTEDYITSVDESLIGGCTIANRGVLYDASLQTSLETLRLTLQN